MLSSYKETCGARFWARVPRQQQGGSKKSIITTVFTNQCKLWTTAACLLPWSDTEKTGYVQPGSQQVAVPCLDIAQTAPGMAKLLAPVLHKHSGQYSPAPARMQPTEKPVSRTRAVGWRLSEQQCPPLGRGRAEMCRFGEGNPNRAAWWAREITQTTRRQADLG